MAQPAVRWNRRNILDTIRRRSLWMEVLGVALVVLGLFALIAIEAASLASVFLLGGILIASGAFYLVASAAYWRVPSGGFAGGILLGALCAITGIFCFASPAGGLVAITLVLGLYFLATGILHLAAALVYRLPGWGWGVAMSMVDLLLGILILAWWPVSSLVVPGTLLGIQLIASGVAAITTGAAVRGLLALPAERDAPTAGRPATRFQH